MQPPLDKDGFLVNLDDWNKEVAEYLAAEEGISLTPEHWEIISALQDFYREFELSPAMRPLSKYLKQTLGNEKSGSIYLMKLKAEF